MQSTGMKFMSFLVILIENDVYQTFYF